MKPLGTGGQLSNSILKPEEYCLFCERKWKMHTEGNFCTREDEKKPFSIADAILDFIGFFSDGYTHMLRAVGYVIYEVILRRPPVAIVGKAIEEAVDENNKKYGHTYCPCGTPNFVSRITGGSGLFQHATSFYRCTTCGRETEDTSSAFYQYAHRELEKRGIDYSYGIKKYRYIIVDEFLEALVFAFGITAFVMVFVFYILDWRGI